MRFVVALSIVLMITILAWTIYPVILIGSKYESYLNLKYVSWDKLMGRWGVGALALKEQVLPKSSEYKEVGLTRVSFNRYHLTQYGYVGMSIEPHRTSEVGDQNFGFSKPYRLLGYVRTTVGEDEMVGMYIGWRSQSGRYGVVNYVIPRVIYDNDGFASRLQDYLQDEMQRPLMPVTQIATEGKCLDLTLGNQGYCDWFMQNQDTIADLALEWAATGELPNALSHYPLLINW